MKVIFIVGPTASGKTKVAIELAKQYGGEVISCDSIQVYKGLDVGSSKPSLQEQEGITHHLLSTIEEGSKYTAGDFRRDALHILSSSKQKLMWIVGGTGFYFKALELGMTNNPKMNEVDRKALEVEWQQKDVSVFYEELKQKDPKRAQEISHNDSYRIFRAIEILRLGFQPSEIKENFTPEIFPYPLLKLGINVPKDILRKRVELRAKQMLENGFELEVQRLRKRGLTNWDPMQSVGYKEMNQYLEGKLAKEKLLPEITTKTMQLVKKQLTWFRKDPEIHWFQPEDMLALSESVKNFIG